MTEYCRPQEGFLIPGPVPDHILEENFVSARADADEPAMDLPPEVSPIIILRAIVNWIHWDRPIRAVWLLLRAGGTDEGVQQQALALLRTFLSDPSVTQEEILLAARGDHRNLSVEDRRAVSTMVREVREQVWNFPVEELLLLPQRPGWREVDYANAITRRIGGVPVDLEGLAGRLGVAVRHVFLTAADLDGMLLRSRDLPTPVAIVNAGRGNEARQRFTLAHELAHAVLPGHREGHVCHQLLQAPRIDPPVPPDSHGKQMAEHSRAVAGTNREAEADRFAAWLLMPPALLQADARRTSFHLDDLDILCMKYQVSFTALVFALVPLSSAPVAALLSQNGRIIRWSKSGWWRWLLKGSGPVHPDSLAAELFEGMSGRWQMEGRVEATVWLDEDAGDLQCWESSRKTAENTVVTVVEMLEEDGSMFS